MSIRQGLCNHLSALGLRQEQVHSLVDETMKWLSRSGTEWTIDRLKDIKYYYLSVLAGKEHTFKTWVSTRSDGSPKGPWGRLDVSTPRKISQTFNALNLYTYFVSQSATRRQEAKFLGSLTHEDMSVTIPVGPPSLAFEPPVVDGYVFTIPDDRKCTLPDPRPWSEHVFGKTRAPLSDGTTVSEDEVDRWLPDNGRVLGSLGLRLKQYRSTLVSAKVASFVRENPIQYPSTGGKISYIQEPGFKLRGIANPFRLWQVLLDPLKTEMFSRLRKMPRDCTYDQNSGVSKVQEWLREGTEVHTLDLSDATNLFPLGFQMGVLTQIFDLDDQATRNQLDFFVRASRARWVTPSGRSVRWTRGQPLGLGPSFAVFAYCHHIVAHALRRLYGGDYVILGDDIVIKGKALSDAYRSFMVLQLGCEISEQKSYSSDRVAEFAGKIITPEAIIPTFKWRQVSDRSFVDVVRSLGPQSISLLKPRQRRVVKILAEVPDFLGGLGWNPRGVPLRERIEYAYQIGMLDTPEEQAFARSPSFTHSRILNKIAYEWEADMPIMCIERQATGRSTRSTVEHLSALCGVTEMSSHPDLIGGYFKMAAPSGDPRGDTTLEILERKFRDYLTDTRLDTREVIPGDPVRTSPTHKGLENDP